MLYMLDTANLEDIKKGYQLYPVCGVTTNPTILSRVGEPVFEHLNKIREIIGEDQMIHVQVTGKTVEEMLAEAKVICERVKGNTYLKVPATEVGIAAMKEMKKAGYKITATAVYTVNQALLVAQAGASFAAPYINRMQVAGIDAYKTVGEMVQVLENYGFDTKILAASFKTADQVYNTALIGAHSITANIETYNLMEQHELTDKAMEGFNDDWEKVYNGKLLTEM
ncbi:MAG: fructose-6-phosphate aldolase [Clostridiaceae bacterium]